MLTLLQLLPRPIHTPLQQQLEPLPTPTLLKLLQLQPVQPPHPTAIISPITAVTIIPMLTVVMVNITTTMVLLLLLLLALQFLLLHQLQKPEGAWNDPPMSIAAAANAKKMKSPKMASTPTKRVTSPFPNQPSSTSFVGSPHNQHQPLHQQQQSALPPPPQGAFPPPPMSRGHVKFC
ncbi:hypothetical protein G6F42_027752 [Rhizopus arrhizus]|nr:hypothetical protein G6F42_027752 [Rhizopus arrhizus]